MSALTTAGFVAPDLLQRELLTQFSRFTQPSSRHQKEVGRFGRMFALEMALCAVRSLTAELRLYPKPGLVSLIDSGSHLDMNATTFMRSVFALRRYFVRITQAGMQAHCFDFLKRLGVQAETGMLRATGGINTHRGAIFCLGLLCAAIGRCQVEQGKLTPDLIRAALLTQWGDALARHALDASSASNGVQVSRLFAVAGARKEAALGMPAVFELGLPVLERRLSDGCTLHDACIDVLFHLMAAIDDTNVYHRGGLNGASIVRQCASRFIERGGTAARDWRDEALNCHRLFVRHRLSPGGAADLLAATCLVHSATGGSLLKRDKSGNPGAS